MKKYLLLLVLIFATAASFAQSSESAASASAATTDTEPDKYQLWMLDALRFTYDQYIQDGHMIFQDYRVYNDITPMQDLEEYGNPGMEAYIEELFMNCERFEEYITEVEDYIYSGGTPLTEDKVNEIEESVRMALEKFVENCCQCAEVYHESYLPFVEEIEGTQSIVDELLVRVSGYSQLIQDRFYKRVESYTLKLSELTKNAYASMKVNTFMEDSRLFHLKQKYRHNYPYPVHIESGKFFILNVSNLSFCQNLIFFIFGSKIEVVEVI